MTAAYISRFLPVLYAIWDSPGVHDRHIPWWREKLSNDALCLQMLDRLLIHPHDVSEYFIGVLA